MLRRVLAILLFVMALAINARGEQRIITGVRVLAPDHLRVTLSRPLANVDANNLRFTEISAPDVPIEISSVEKQSDNVLLITVKAKLDPSGAYRLEIKESGEAREVRPAPWALLLTVILSSALINNFVFTRYLGLCIFFGVSKKRDTSIGMGITFTLVMVLSSVISWALFTFVLYPLRLKFLQVIVFIGVVAFLVQALDTILKKTNRPLHQRFGVYLMLITTNCIILAVPLLNAASNASLSESFALAVGSGLGFALALFLMSCAREKVELARVPAAFQGLPIAFALAGMFALAFMGFSGLSFLK